MVVFPNAKINLGLYITGKRPDGYHNLVSCFLPVPWFDVLEIIEAHEVAFESSGTDIPGEKTENLCLKAYHLLRKDFGLPPISIHLIKKIPIGAGLGGGSADASFMLRACNELFALRLSTAQLHHYAAQLGSDCPFFLKNVPAIARGTGHELSPVNLNLDNLFLVMVNPGIHVSTAEAYRGLSSYSPEPDLEQWLKEPIRCWKDSIINDFEASVFKNHPQINTLKDNLYQQGARYASMSGSGATVFAIFDHEVELESAFPEHYQVKSGWLTKQQSLS